MPLGALQTALRYLKQICVVTGNKFNFRYSQNRPTRPRIGARLVRQLHHIPERCRTGTGPWVMLGLDDIER